MTTNVKIQSHNYPAKVVVSDFMADGSKVQADSRIVFAEDGEQTFYCTTSRIVEVFDLDYNDVEVVAERTRRASVTVPK